jgi:SAM-dependent methyltransferase
LPKVLAGKFDVVFTSYGAICWLADLRRWAETIKSFLKTGGIFYMVEVHPFANIFDDRPGVTDLRVAYSYFDSGPIKEQSVGSYADRSASVAHSVSYSWQHQLGDVVNHLIAAGLTIEFVHEFPHGVCATLACMQQSNDGWWRPAGQQDKVPFLFSLKAKLGD